MFLIELFDQTEEKADDGRYDPDSDQTIVKKDDTRKTRLTLKQINKFKSGVFERVKNYYNWDRITDQYFNLSKESIK